MATSRPATTTACAEAGDEASLFLTRFFFVSTADALPRLGRVLLERHVRGNRSDDQLQLVHSLAKPEWQALREELAQGEPVLASFYSNGALMRQLGLEALSMLEVGAADAMCSAVAEDEMLLYWLAVISTEAFGVNEVSDAGWKEAQHLLRKPEEVGHHFVVDNQGWAYLTRQHCGQHTKYSSLPSEFLKWFACLDLPQVSTPHGAEMVAVDMGIISKSRLAEMKKQANADALLSSTAELVLQRLQKELRSSMLTHTTWSLLLVEQAMRDEPESTLADESRSEQCLESLTAVVEFLHHVDKFLAFPKGRAGTFDADVGPNFRELMKQRDFRGASAALAVVQQASSRSLARAARRYLRLSPQIFAPPSWADQASAHGSIARERNGPAQGAAAGPAGTPPVQTGNLGGLSSIDRRLATYGDAVSARRLASADMGDAAAGEKQAMERFVKEVSLAATDAQLRIEGDKEVQMLEERGQAEDEQRLAALAARQAMWLPSESTGGVSMLMALRSIEQGLDDGPPVVPLIPGQRLHLPEGFRMPDWARDKARGIEGPRVLVEEEDGSLTWTQFAVRSKTGDHHLHYKECSELLQDWHGSVTVKDLELVKGALVETPYVQELKYTPQNAKDVPTVVLLFPSEDSNGAFHIDDLLCKRLACWAKQGYKVVARSVDGPRDAARVVQSFSPNSLHHVSVGGHGRPGMVHIGEGPLGTLKMGAKTTIELFASIKERLTPQGTVHLDACDTARGTEMRPKRDRNLAAIQQGYQRNMFEYAKLLIGDHKVFAPTRSYREEDYYETADYGKCCCTPDARPHRWRDPYGSMGEIIGFLELDVFASSTA